MRTNVYVSDSFVFFNINVDEVRT